MKNIVVCFVALFSCITFTSEAEFYYTSGKGLKGKKVESTGFLGYESSCFRGNPWEARSLLVNMATDDYEKTDVAVWYNQKSECIEFKYVDTKCTDEGESKEDCTNTVIIPECN